MDKLTELTIDYNALDSHFKSPLNMKLQYKTQAKYWEFYFICLTLKLQVKSHFPSAGIIRSAPYSPR